MAEMADIEEQKSSPQETPELAENDELAIGDGTVSDAIPNGGATGASLLPPPDSALSQMNSPGTPTTVDPAQNNEIPDPAQNNENIPSPVPSDLAPTNPEEAPGSPLVKGPWLYDVFFSLRFKEALPEAKLLRTALEEKGLKCFLGDTRPGGRVLVEVSEALAKSKLALVFGTSTYGKDTQIGFSTHDELTVIQTRKRNEAFLIKMCDEYTESLTQLFTSGRAFYEWRPQSETGVEPIIPVQLVDMIMNKLADIDKELTRSSMSGSKTSSLGQATFHSTRQVITSSPPVAVPIPSPPAKAGIPLSPVPGQAKSFWVGLLIIFLLVITVIVLAVLLGIQASKSPPTTSNPTKYPRYPTKLPTKSPLSFLASGSSLGFTLLPDKNLTTYQYLISPNQVYKAILESSGIFRLLKGTTEIFSTGTGCTTLQLSKDGSLNFFTVDSAPCGGLSIRGQGPSKLTLGNLGALRLLRINDSYMVWSANTGMGSTISSETTLSTGDMMFSPSTLYMASLMEDGTFSLTNTYTGSVVGQILTGLCPKCSYLTLQADGNFVAYSYSGAINFKALPSGSGGPSTLTLQDDGVLVLTRIADQKLLWISGVSVTLLGGTLNITTFVTAISKSPPGNCEGVISTLQSVIGGERSLFGCSRNQIDSLNVFGGHPSKFGTLSLMFNGVASEYTFYVWDIFTLRPAFKGTPASPSPCLWNSTLTSVGICPVNLLHGLIETHSNIVEMGENLENILPPENFVMISSGSPDLSDFFGAYSVCFGNYTGCGQTYSFYLWDASHHSAFFGTSFGATIISPQILQLGDFLVSQNLQYKGVLELDSTGYNFRVYNNSEGSILQIGPFCQECYGMGGMGYLHLQSDGTLVLLSPENVLWISSPSLGILQEASLTLGDDGTIIIRNPADGSIHWSLLPNNSTQNSSLLLL